MKLSTLMARLQRIAAAGSDPDVMVSVQSQGELRGPTPAVGIIGAHAGFDWDSGRVLLTPAQPVVALTPEQVEAIVKSVRSGQSWHAYQTSLSSKLAGDVEPSRVSWSDYHIASADNEKAQREPILQLVQSDSQVYSADGLRGRDAPPQSRAACQRSELLAAVRRAPHIQVSEKIDV